jgi:hypothetical protein
VTAELLPGSALLEMVARRVDGGLISRTIWSIEDFGEDTLENIAEWLEVMAARANGRHLHVMG